MDVLTWLVHMAPKECEDLLAASSVGRLGVIVDGRPEIFPINHVYDRGIWLHRVPDESRHEVPRRPELANGCFRGRRSRP